MNSLVCSNFYLKLLYQPVFKAPVKADPVGILQRRLVAENQNVGAIRWWKKF